MTLCVAETRPCCELQAQRFLFDQGFETLYPTYYRERRTPSGAVTLVVPLFPGYVFVELDLDRQRWRSVNGTPGVRRLLGGNPERPTGVPEKVAQVLRERCAAGTEQDPDAAMRALIEGAQVRGCVPGHWAHDMVGRVARLDGRERVVVLMFLLGRLTEVSFRRTEVERVL